MQTLRILLLLVCVWIGFPRAAFAEPITIAFTATVSDVRLGGSLLASYGLNVGTEVLGEVSWDTNAFVALNSLADQVSTTDAGSYALRLNMIAAGTSFSSFTDSFNLDKSGSLGSFTASLDNIILQGEPYPDWAVLALQSTSPELVPTLFELLQDFKPTLWNQGRIRVGNESIGGGGAFDYYATINEVRAVPEPPSWLLVGFFGLIALGLSSRAIN